MDLSEKYNDDFKRSYQILGESMIKTALAILKFRDSLRSYVDNGDYIDHFMLWYDNDVVFLTDLLQEKICFEKYEQAAVIRDIINIKTLKN